jgi:ribonuclease BN (tRNA processing enzyme)
MMTLAVWCRGVLALALLVASGLTSAQSATPAQCGTEGVWIQVLGSGAAEPGDDRAGPSYLVWINGRARVLINSGPGAALRFSEAGARLEDLDTIAYTQLQADHVSDLPAFLRAGASGARQQPLVLLGPDGSERWPGTAHVIERLIGADGAFPQYQELLSPAGANGFRVRVRDVPATGARRWAEHGAEDFSLAAIPVNHGNVPALAWRIDAAGRSVTVAGSFSNQKGTVSGFAASTDALIVHHAVPEGARGPIRDVYVRPSQIGRIAGQIRPRVLILGYRAQRTRGFQTQTLDLIGEHFGGRIVLANDAQCLGLNGR